MTIVIEKESVVSLMNSDTFKLLPEDIRLLIDVLATEIDYDNVEAVSLRLDTKVLDAYSFPTDTPEKIAEYEALSFEEKYYVQRTLFGVTREEMDPSFVGDL